MDWSISKPDALWEFPVTFLERTPQLLDTCTNCGRRLRGDHAVVWVRRKAAEQDAPYQSDWQMVGPECARKLTGYSGRELLALNEKAKAKFMELYPAYDCNVQPDARAYAAEQEAQK